MPTLRSLAAAGFAVLALAACTSVRDSIYDPSHPQASRSRPQPAPMASTMPGIDPNGAPAVVSDGRRLQCVPFARNLSGIQIFGDANTWWDQASGRYPRSAIPAPGAVLVLRGYNTATRGHVAVVTGLVASRELRVDQANWLNGEEITVRVPVLDVSDNNDWSRIRMWHIPSGQWGVRVYETQGFIHPLPMILGS